MDFKNCPTHSLSTDENRIVDESFAIFPSANKTPNQ